MPISSSQDSSPSSFAVWVRQFFSSTEEFFNSAEISSSAATSSSEASPARLSIYCVANIMARASVLILPSVNRKICSSASVFGRSQPIICSLLPVAHVLEKALYTHFVTTLLAFSWSPVAASVASLETQRQHPALHNPSDCW